VKTDATEASTSPPKKKVKAETADTDLLKRYQVEKWPEVPLKRISEVTLALLNELVRTIRCPYMCIFFLLVCIFGATHHHDLLLVENIG
jgi:hypothetical protein